MDGFRTRTFCLPPFIHSANFTVRANKQPVNQDELLFVTLAAFRGIK